MSDILIESKKYIHAFYQDGVWVDSPILVYNGKAVDPDVIEYLRELFLLFLESRFLSDYTKIYLKSPLSSMRQVFELYNESHSLLDRVNRSTAFSNIQYDKKKLKPYFPSDCLSHLMGQKERYLEDMRKTLEQLELKYYEDKEYREALLVKIPKESLRKDISEKDWNRLLRFLKTYSKKAKGEIEKGEWKRYGGLFGYYHFLILGKRLNAEEKERLKEIREILGLENPLL